MLNSLLRLLGEDAVALRRYVRLALAHGLLCGLTIAALAPVVARLLAGDGTGAAAWLAALLAGIVLCWILRRLVEQAGVRAGVAVLQAGRHRLGEHVARLPVGWFTAHNTASLGHVVTQGLMAVAQLPAHVFTPVITGLATPLVMVAVLCWLDLPLGLLALAALPLLGAVFMLTGRLARRSGAAFQHNFAAASARVVEFAQAQSVLRAFNGEGNGERLLEQAVEEQRRSGLRLIWRSALSSVLNAWAVQAVFAGLLIALAWSLDGRPGAPSSTVAVVAVLLLVRYIDGLMEVSGYADALRGARGQLDAVDALFAAAPLPEPQAPRAPRDASVELRAVRFQYAADAPEALRGVSLRIAPGEMTALIGVSGSGKTTLARLVARFFDASAGSVLVGGVDVRDMSSDVLGAQISQIFQDNFLFSGSIADNIRIGKPGATDAEVVEAARDAGLALATLPQGLDTPVGEGGARLSGGERQRIAIARALVKDAPIMLVDEATAALDAENQAIVAAALARLRGRRTLLVIAHQLSTVALADTIVVLEDGQVVEHGAPAALRARDGRYARFLRRRSSALGWRIADADAEGARL